MKSCLKQLVLSGRCAVNCTLEFSALVSHRGLGTSVSYPRGASPSQHPLSILVQWQEPWIRTGSLSSLTCNTRCWWLQRLRVALIFSDSPSHYGLKLTVFFRSQLGMTKPSRGAEHRPGCLMPLAPPTMAGSIAGGGSSTVKRPCSTGILNYNTKLNVPFLSSQLLTKFRTFFTWAGFWPLLNN